MKSFIFFAILFCASVSQAKVADWSKVKVKDLCMFNVEDLQKVIGSYEDHEICRYADQESYLFGREWVILKRGKAFAIINHTAYSGPCWDSYSGKYVDMCKD